MTPEEMRRLRRIAREAQRTYVGTHWPSMEEMRNDGIGHGHQEDRKHDPFIRRFLATFGPELVGDLLDMLASSDSALAEIAGGQRDGAAIVHVETARRALAGR